LRKTVFSNSVRQSEILQLLGMSLVLHGLVAFLIFLIHIYSNKPLPQVQIIPPIEMIQLQDIIPDPVIEPTPPEPAEELPNLDPEPQTSETPPETPEGIQIAKSSQKKISSSQLASSANKKPHSSTTQKSSQKASSQKAISSASKNSAKAQSSASFTLELPKFQKLPSSQTGPVVSAVDPRLGQYVQQIKNIVQPKWKPPQGADVRDSIQIVVRVTLNRNGSKTIDKVFTCGNNTLDRLARRAIEISTFPPLPVQYPEDSWTFDYGFVYKNDE
jgi:outer membrane biosynthesis protein TonB